MELLILDKDFNNYETLDIFESLIWTDRYCGYGDFEIYMPANKDVLSVLKKDYYLYLKESEHIMVIEDTEIDTDKEEGSHVKVTGRSLESVLDRRIVWNQTVIKGNLQNGIKKLLDENAISPSDESRKIPNLVFKENSDERITSLEIETQYYGEKLYDAIAGICKSVDIGFKIILDGTDMVFSLYIGEDRSYEQDKNPFVVFSPGYDNLLNSNYIESVKTLKTVTLVAGEGEGSNRKTTTVEADGGAGTGLDRREMFTDAAGISQTVDGEQISDSEYKNQLAQKGKESLAENKMTTSFEGEVDSLATYEYGVDYYLGDIVQVGNEFGSEARSRITEFVRSQNETGIEIYPTFENV